MNKREAKAAERNERIIAAATSLFAKQGYSSTKMSDVAEAADVAVGTIYLRYPNKHALLAGILGFYESKFVDAMMAEAVQTLPWPDRFAAMFGAILSTAAGIPDMPALMQLAIHAQDDDWSSGAQIRAAITQVMIKAQSEGVFRQDVAPDMAAAAAYGMVDGAMQHLMRRPEVDPGQVVGMLTDASARWLLI